MAHDSHPLPHADADIASLREQRISILQQEASDIFNAGRAAVVGADRVLAVAVTLATAALTLAVDKNHPAIFLALPSVLCLLLTYQLQIFADAAIMGVYRGYLESVIDKQLYPMASKSVRPGLIFFQRELAGLRSGRNGGRRQYPSIIGAQLLYATIVLVIAIYGGFVAYDVRFSFLENWPIPLILYVIIFAEAFAILVSAFIEVKRAEEKSRNVVALMTAESRDGSADGQPDD